jgi:phospholipase C
VWELGGGQADWLRAELAVESQAIQRPSNYPRETRPYSLGPAQAPLQGRTLCQIEHIVVLMMENRSFDQILGYLKRDGLSEVDG